MVRGQASEGVGNSLLGVVLPGDPDAVIYQTAYEGTGVPWLRRHAFVRWTPTTLCGLELATQVIMAIPEVRWDDEKDETPRCPKCLAAAR